MNEQEVQIKATALITIIGACIAATNQGQLLFTVRHLTKQIR